MAHQQNFASYPDLNGRVALILGAGQSGDPNSKFWGNGAAIAKVLSASGTIIIACDMSMESAQRTATHLRDSGGICEPLQADVTKSADIQQTVEIVMQKYGRIDILVNNVGNTRTGDPATMPEEIWDAQIELNLKSVYLSCHAVLPIMEKQGSGCVINNASITGLRYIGKPQVAYASAKAAVIHFTKVSAIMFASKGVRMNSVSPGLIYTPLLEKFKESSQEEDREVYKRITQHNVPMGCMGDAFDVANTVAFLSSHASRYITGQNLVMDGGLTGSTGTGA